MYMTAAHLIETRTGLPLKEFFRTRLWEPLNMTETYLSSQDAQKAGEDIARGYYLDPENLFQDAQNPHQDNLRGASNVLSSATDYAKWLRAMIHRQPPLSPAGHAAVTGAHSILIPQVMPPYSSPILYGFGWMSESYKGQTVIQHDGATWGFGALALFLPDLQLGIAIFGNDMERTNAASSVLVYHIIDEILGTPEDELFDWVKRYVSLCLYLSVSYIPYFL
jgi:CubicO group peptidase (beta-lactamase class C family)